MKSLFCMLSGGVDSSVAAAKLKEQGYNVTGIFMKCWSQQQLLQLGLDPKDYACSWDEDAKDAEWVAKKLDIPFVILDLQKSYFQHVVQYMIDGYKSGITPNPDIMCNSFIKFGVFSQKAFAEGAEWVATGHYAKKTWSDTYQTHLIARAKDATKDQSYFLSRIQPEVLQQSLFPIGEYLSKKDVRAEAAKLGLITADKPDSQGICFIGDTPLRELLIQTLGQQNGHIIDVENNHVIGEHQGVFLFTIGQRHGLKLNGGPWFVHSLDAINNIVFVTKNISSIEKNQFKIGSIHTFIPPEYLVQLLKTPELQKNISVQTRYRQASTPCKIRLFTNNSDTLCITTDSLVRAITPGQTASIYDRDQLILSGIIC